ncbi:MAG: NUDIX domain-containing protein [Emcibacteraceae bacterium]|nr:NUDIX domain-containing protein [Emcibacteraceae bacterium]
MPGGAQKLSEKLAETAVREVYEETSILIKNITLIDAVNLIEHNGNKVIGYHYSLVDYMAEYTSGKLQTGDNLIDAKWVSINDLKAYNLWVETTKLIKTAYKMKKEIYQIKGNSIFERLIKSIGQHLKFLAIAVAFSILVYGGIYLLLSISGKI